MPARSIATATISFGLVSVPVNIYSSSESKTSVSFNERIMTTHESEKDRHQIDRAKQTETACEIHYCLNTAL